MSDTYPALEEASAAIQMDPHYVTGGLELIIKHQSSKAHNASLLVQNLSRFVISFLKRNKASRNKFQQLKNIVYKLLQSLYERSGRRYLGIGIAFSGRAYGAKKAASFKMLFGSVPFNTLAANIDYANITEKTGNGT